MNVSIPTLGKITPYPFQWEIIEAIKNHIREEWTACKSGEKSHADPAIVEAYVSAGKTILLGAIARHCQDVGARCMVLARQGELVEQNAEECWNMGAKNSVFSASLGIKSTHFPIIVGTEKTVANALFTQLKDYAPHILLIDETHMVHWRDVLNGMRRANGENVEGGDTSFAKIINELRRRFPRIAIIGVTGTPYRGLESIVGKRAFFKKRLGPKIGREFLVDNGYIVPTVFGYSELEYNMKEFDPENAEGTQDFSAADLKKMGDQADVTLTHKIMNEVVGICEKRNGVLVTCASKRHCEEAASVLPNGSYGIVTDSTPKKERAAILAAAKDGMIKYVFQIGCLTTGVNIPFWDTSVILRRIGSLTLLVQLLGRGMRLLKPEQVKAGIVKNEHLCLDYSGTMEAMQQLFDDPILDEADVERTRKRKQEPKYCPKCQTENGSSARRCINRDDKGERCDFFWSSKSCPKCKAENDSSAKECRKCDHQLVDPNAALAGKHYGPDDWFEVDNMKIQPTRNGGVLVIINYRPNDAENQGPAKMMFNPWSSPGAKRVFEHQFLAKFTANYADRRKLMGAKTAEALMAMKHLIKTPVRTTHRKNEKGYSVVHGIDFGNLMTMGGKKVDQ
jgi:superfamily II DNA or RNA helicase